MQFLEDKEIVLTDGRDLLNTLPYAQTLVDAVKASPPGFNIGLFGEWGSGKSSVIKTAKALLESDRKLTYKVVIYDAWKYSGDSFRRMFLLELKNSLGVEVDDKFDSFYVDKTQDVSVDRKIKPSSLILLIVATLILLSSIFWQGFTHNIIQTLGTIFLIFIAIFNNLFHDMRVSVHKPKTFAPEQFQECYMELLEVALKTTSIETKLWKWVKGDGYNNDLDRLVIVIDNLDRCDQKITFELLSDIKNFLGNVAGVNFIVPVDDNAIRKHLASHYTGEEQTADEFLRKFFNVAIKLKPLASIDLFSFTSKICAAYDINLMPETVDAISKEFASNPRRIIQIVNNLSAELALLERSPAAHLAQDYETVVAIVLIIRDEWPNLYIELFNHPEKLLGFDQLSDDYGKGKMFLRRVSGLLVNVDVSTIEQLYRYTDGHIDVPTAVLDAIEKRDKEALTSSIGEQPQIVSNTATIIVEELDNAWKRGTLKLSGVDAVQRLAFVNSVFPISEHDARRINAVLTSDKIIDQVLPLIKEHEQVAKLLGRLEVFNLMSPVDDALSVLNTYFQELVGKTEAWNPGSIQEPWPTLLISFSKYLTKPDNLKRLKNWFNIYMTVEGKLISDLDIPSSNLAVLASPKLLNDRIARVSFLNAKTFQEIERLRESKLINSQSFISVLEKMDSAFQELNSKPYEDVLNSLDMYLNLLSSWTISLSEQITPLSKNAVEKFFVQMQFVINKEVKTARPFEQFMIDNKSRSLFFDYCYHVYRIFGDNTSVQTVLLQIASQSDSNRQEVDAVLERLTELNLFLIPFHEYIAKSKIMDDPRLVRITKYLLGCKKKDQSYAFTNESLAVLVDSVITSATSGIDVSHLLEEIGDEPRFKEILKDKLIALPREQLLKLPSNVQEFAFDHISANERIFEFESDIDLLKVIAKSGQTRHKSALVPVIIRKLAKTETANQAIGILKEFDSFKGIDTNEIKSLLKKVQKNNEQLPIKPIFQKISESDK